MSRKTIRVLIVDDHAIVREGYRALLAKHEGLMVVGEASDAASAYQCYKDTRPDVVIMDISMPGRGGIDALEHIREFDAHARISAAQCRFQQVSQIAARTLSPLRDGGLMDDGLRPCDRARC